MKPQDIGFKEDNSAVQNMIEQIEKISSDPEKKIQTVAELKDAFANASDNETAFVIEYASSVIAAYPDVSAVANAVERGSRDALQEYIGKANLPEKYQSADDLSIAIKAAIELAKEKKKETKETNG